MVVPVKNAHEDAAVSGLQVYRIENLGDGIDFFNGARKFYPVSVDLIEIYKNEANKYDVDFSDVKGLDNVIRALEVAAAGGHNYIILLIASNFYCLLLFCKKKLKYLFD